MAAALALVFFAALSHNLLLNFALGIKILVLRELPPAAQLYHPWLILFLSTPLLWVVFARILFFIGLDFLLAVPLSALGSMGLEYLFFRFVSPYINPEKSPGLFSIGSPCNGFAVVSLLLTLRFAVSFIDALLLSFAFSAGGFFAYLIIREIQRRSFLETVPYGLRGIPLVLISMGLLSLVFSAASVLFLKIFL
ncbi:MAG: hypothetical protein LBH07_02480 [Treponema sp.]|jgi:electron transport complex protein RnfA|nr:hypothetical protein [Treponema sp.]